MTAPVHTIADWLEASAQRVPERIAVEEGAGRGIRYDTFAALAAQVGNYLVAAGVQPGVRVVVAMRKTVDLLVTFHAILRCGATYVPADPLAPAARAAFIAKDCEAAVVIADEQLADGLLSALIDAQWNARLLRVPARPRPGTTWRVEALTHPCAPAALPETVERTDAAFLLYTSGSTGVPKAVTVTHENVITFIDWCSTWVSPTEKDRFAAHAPLHFSLSVFNIYLPWKHGARIVLFDEETARVPALVAPRIEHDRITVWFSTPTILSWLAKSGLLPSLDLGALRLVMFSGESFPVPALQHLMAQLPGPRYVHTLGCTETHMIARYEVPRDGALPVKLPVGRVAGHFRSRVVDEQANDVAPGRDGELWLTGPGVIEGYWRRPTETAAAFVVDAAGVRWYRTRDIVTRAADGTLVHRSRRDRVIKKRGNRVELGEVEACLYRHEQVREVAVVAVADAVRGVQMKAFVVPHGVARPSIVQLKAHCSNSLPAYMVPDLFDFADALPRTSNGKIDFPRLQALV